MFHDLVYRFKALFRRKSLDTDLNEELTFHLEQQARKSQQLGASPAEAHLQAHRSFGGLEQIREECRDARGTRLVQDFLQDCRYTVRTARNNKVFFLVIVLVLALGIGVNSAVFTVVNAVILKPLPFRNASRLLTVWDTYLPQFSKVGISPLELQAWEAQRDLFEDTAWYRYVPLDGNLSASGFEPMAVHAGFVSDRLFPMLGIAPLVGRQMGPVEDSQSVLLSERLWRSRFASDRKIVGRTMRFNDQQLTVIGVMAEATQFPDWADLWLPKGPLLSDQLTNPVRHALGFIARRRSGSKCTTSSGSLI